MLWLFAAYKCKHKQCQTLKIHYYQGHKKEYQPPIRYRVKFDNETITEQGNNVAERVLITTKLPGKSPKKIEVMMIAQCRHQKLYRIWELTYPNWRSLKAFKAFSK